MNNPNPFLPHSSFLEQKNKARNRLKIVVLFSISLSVVALMALLIQGCRKPAEDTTPPPDTNTAPAPTLPTNPPETGSNTAMAPAPDTNPPPPPPPVMTPPVMTPPPAPVGQDYTIVKGDTLATIAKKNGMSVRALQEANPGVDPKRLKIGQKLHLPAAASPGATAAPMAPGMETAAPTGGEQTYKVKSGDTLTTIAKHYHVSIKAIESANHLSTTSIKVGQVLKIPASAAAAPAPAPAPAPAEMAPPPAPASTSAPAPLPAPGAH